MGIKFNLKVIYSDPNDRGITMERVDEFNAKQSLIPIASKAQEEQISKIEPFEKIATYGLCD